jgi:hypothetical protein
MSRRGAQLAAATVLGVAVALAVLAMLLLGLYEVHRQGGAWLGY